MVLAPIFVYVVFIRSGVLQKLREGNKNEVGKWFLDIYGESLPGWNSLILLNKHIAMENCLFEVPCLI